MSTRYLKLTAYFAERHRTGGRLTVDALLDLFAQHEVATSVVLRGIAGFGPHHELRTDVTLSLSEDPPITVTTVDVAERVSVLAPHVADLVHRGLVTVERARRPDDAALDQDAQLTIFLSGGDRSPAPHVAVGEVLRAHGFAGATAFFGVDGTVRGGRTRSGFFSRNHDVPVMMLAVGPADAARRAYPQIEAVPGVQLVTADAAQVCKVGGRLLARPVWPADDAAAATHRLIVHTDASDLHDGLPVHRALLRALREVPLTAGVTILHGMWGFQGDRPPRYDRLFQLTRRAPVTTVMVDTADRISAAFDVVDTLTGGFGVVSTGAVPTAVSIDDGDRRGGLRPHP